MRVLFITNAFPPDNTGEAEMVTYHTCRGLMQRGLACSVLVLNNRMAPALDEREEFDNIPVHRIYAPCRQRRARTDIFDWWLYRAVLAEWRRFKPDLVHIHHVSGATLAPYLACRTVRVPVVNTLTDFWLLCANNMLYRDASHGGFCSLGQNPEGCQLCNRRHDYWGAISHRRQRLAKLTSNVRYFISPSQALIERHVEAGYERDRFRLVRFGFSPTLPAPPQHPVVRQIVETSHRYRTLWFPGGGSQIKGATVVLEALPILLRHVENLRLLVRETGEEDYLEQFRQFGSAVQLLASLPFNERQALFNSADLTLLASLYYDTSPVTIYSSYQVGTPVVGSGWGAIPELIRDGETGYLFPVGNPSLLAERIVWHFARPANERRRMRHYCMQEIRSTLSLDQHLDGVLAVYKEAVPAQQ